ncbi:hypothetical protein [Paenimyroides baculatum]|uniref:Glycosyl transferase family 2 n=1 Tax=Paenimyroides baculatum TaxID=2608000 RepID=A0A5M6CQ99_9FLAO|nr:hypothetical protein [Paenimyroides baculatum]KAA5535299.1 hypothetical protein F0460_08255 [Paenimyroides baculatum]
MDIYIKSFNRAYLLHRTIASIYYYLNGFDGRIIVLDDGTPQKYLDKIVELFPDIQIIKSPYYEQKSKDISLIKVPKKVIPADFWRDEVLKGSEYFILLEDDMWFTQPVNYKDFTKEIYDLKMDMIKFLWLKNTKLISDNIIQKTAFFNIVQPKVLTKNPFLFDAIFRTNKFKLGSLVIKLFNHKLELLKYYRLYMVAGGVFSKRYYETCWKSSQDNVDELKQISQLLKSKIDTNIGNFKKEILKTTLKTTATLISKENLGITIDIFKINEILNEEWLNGNTYKIDDFNSDISTDWISKSLLKITKNKSLYSTWETWYEAFRLSYKKIGSEI